MRSNSRPTCRYVKRQLDSFQSDSVKSQKYIPRVYFPRVVYDEERVQRKQTAALDLRCERK